MLFLLDKKLEEAEPVYDAVGAEQGIIEITNSRKIYCYYDDGVMPTYDGKSLDTLKQDIRNTEANRIKTK